VSANLRRTCCRSILSGPQPPISDFLTRGYEHPVTAESLFVTAGNSQALDFVCGQFARQGDTVFIEEPSYFLAHQIFADHGLKAVGIPVDEDGLKIDVLTENCRSTARFFCTPSPVFTIRAARP
jgi:DNA-binding transcriptional MocR family regulator